MRGGSAGREEKKMTVKKADRPCENCGLVKWFGKPHPYQGKRTPPETRLCTGKVTQTEVWINDKLLVGWNKR